MYYRLDSTTQIFTKLILLKMLVLVPVYSTALETDQIPKDEILPTDVFLHVSRVGAELELLRYHMGKPKTNTSQSVC